MARMKPTWKVRFDMRRRAQGAIDGRAAYEERFGPANQPLWIPVDPHELIQVIDDREVDRELLEAIHSAADELDRWDGDAVPNFDGMSAGGLIRLTLHEAAGLDMDSCPVCQERASWVRASLTEHELIVERPFARCTCGWEPELGQSIMRAFDQHLLDQEKL